MDKEQRFPIKKRMQKGARELSGFLAVGRVVWFLSSQPRVVWFLSSRPSCLLSALTQRYINAPYEEKHNSPPGHYDNYAQLK